jgi:predicted ATPase/class 3 adenylate cyclase
MSDQQGAGQALRSSVTSPTGTVTFLFSDIEGSTQRWEQHRVAMQAAVARHEQLMADAIKRHGGYVFKMIGDAFCVAFATAPAAVAAAVDAQLALAREDFSAVGGLRVRIGLHTGHAEERNADYFGPAVNRIARLVSIGHGGQILLSGVTRELAYGDLPRGSSLVDLGSHRLKDLIEPEQVWQLAASGLPSEFPPLNSLDARPNNLPAQVTTLIGRERDLDDIRTLIGKHRLVTVAGSGGIGKTRVALHLGADLIDRFPDGVWFADLAPIADTELVASVIAKAIGLSQVEGRRVDESISQWLKRKTSLLILDNCEHLLGAVAAIADVILRSCPNVRLLATSREALGIAGEAVHRLPSLAVPESGSTPRVEDALRYGAVALFADRAALVDTRFVLNDDTAPIVADICRRLDGIALAIELAAARVKVLSIPNLAQRLSERFKILTGGSRTALPRQKTLSALIDWSYDLLTTQEKMLFDRLGIFAGGFSLDAATVVCSGDALEANAILDLLSSLTDKSLVVADIGERQTRYRLLESTRAYALERLAAAGEHQPLACRHGECFRDLALEADARYGIGSTLEWLSTVELDVDNFRAVLEWALTDGNDPVLAGTVAGALGPLWFDGGQTVEGRYWIGRAQAQLEEAAHPKIAARMWRALAMFSDGKGIHDCAVRAMALYESAGDRSGVAWALGSLGRGLLLMGHLEEASTANARALAAMRELADRPGVATCLARHASIQLTRGDLIAARDLSAEALAAYKALHDEAGTAIVLANLAELEFRDGRADQALRFVGEAVEIHTRGKNALALARVQTNSAAYLIALGEIDRAREAVREGLRGARRARRAQGIAISIQHLALVGALHGDSHRASQLVGFVNAQYREIGAEREYTETWAFEKLMAALREHLSEAEIDGLTTEGAAWSEDQAVEEALKI